MRPTSRTKEIFRRCGRLALAGLLVALVIVLVELVLLLQTMPQPLTQVRWVPRPVEPSSAQAETPAPPPQPAVPAIAPAAAAPVVAPVVDPRPPAVLELANLRRALGLPAPPAPVALGGLAGPSPTAPGSRPASVVVVNVMLVSPTNSFPASNRWSGVLGTNGTNQAALASRTNGFGGIAGRLPADAFRLSLP